MGGAALQHRVQGLVRGFHHRFFSRPLPRKLALYLHATAGHRDGLEELLCFLREQNYFFVGPDEFMTTAERAVFLSFDDNFRSWLDALEILQKFGVPATFYVNSWPFRDRVGAAEVSAYLEKLDVASDRETTLSTDELRDIASCGHIIGAHTHTHPVLTSLPQHLAREEIRTCKEELEQILHHSVVHFSYPFGMRRHFNDVLRAYCRSIGFRTIANAIPGMQFAPSRAEALHRSVWFLEQPLEFNLANVCVDGRLFEMLTGRSAVGGSPS
jgi:peptidoglycan/xylan/chitin deacetylase (PgdA/CDA1 family)